uniref:TPR_REGION domain-containing protein n=1 Tax=Parastrongyloides trichosuri TaxID=131310 RepID=A0A0N5A1C2_PARTI
MDSSSSRIEMNVPNKTHTSILHFDTPYTGDKIFSDLKFLNKMFTDRAMIPDLKWISEIHCSLPEEWSDGLFVEAHYQPSLVFSETHKQAKVNFACVLIYSQEYIRASQILTPYLNTNNPIVLFLHYYARFLASEQDCAENEGDPLKRSGTYISEDLILMRKELQSLLWDNYEEADISLLYLLSIINIRLKHRDYGREILRGIIKREPRFWPAYKALSTVVDDLQMLKKIVTGQPDKNSWMLHLFMAETCITLHQYDMSADILTEMKHLGLSDVSYIDTKLALSMYERQSHVSAVELFEDVLRRDPHRIDDMNYFADALYVRGERALLSKLAQSFNKTHKFHYITCMILANYYSLSGDSEKAITFLNRAYRLNPLDANVWILLGHEMMTQRNQSGALAVYRKAIEIDNKNYKTWYGLGQLHDIMKQPMNALYHYRNAFRINNSDSRILVAMGCCFTKLKYIKDAENYFIKAFILGDVEGTSLIYLAKLLIDQDRKDEAADVYRKYLDTFSSKLVSDSNKHLTCIKYLAEYCCNNELTDEARIYVDKCLEHASTRELGLALRKKLDEGKAEPSAHSQKVNESYDILCDLKNTLHEDDMDVDANSEYSDDNDTTNGNGSE